MVGATNIGGKNRPLKIALIVTLLYTFVEAIGGLLTKSLALLADAGHMLSDVTALGITLFAIKVAERPPTQEKTYGYHRAEILAALANGLTLWLIAGLILHEAYHRFFSPPEVKGIGMLSVAAVGLGINIGVALMLKGRTSDSLNLRGAYLHVVSDALGSIGAITAAVIILITGWNLADPLVTVIIAGLILYSSWDLIRESVDILMEATPEETDIKKVRDALAQIAGVLTIHDLHIWALTSGVYTLSAHATVSDLSEGQQILREANKVLQDMFRIGHVTLQLEEVLDEKSNV